MKKAADYRKFAKECRSLAETIGTERGRSQLLKIAQEWEALARDRERRVKRDPAPSVLQRVVARVFPSREGRR
jgi:hypothetical protein